VRAFVVPFLLLTACGTDPLPAPESPDAGDPLALTRESVAPPESAPPPGVSPVGEFQLVRANRDALLPIDAPMTVTLPVPDGTPTDGLWAAKVVDASTALDGATRGDRWLLLDGVYDPAGRTFSTRTASVTAAGDRYVLVTRSDFVLPVQAKPTVLNGFDFFGSCLEMDEVECSQALLDETAAVLADVRGHLRAMGFPEPRLRVQTAPGDPENGLGFAFTIAASDSSHCVDDEGDPVLGIYYATEGLLIVCAPDDPVAASELHATIVHEYFHATQYAFDAVLHGPRQEPFLLEGTATAAELSYPRDVGTGDLMSRTTFRKLHAVDIPLPTDDDSPGGEDMSYEYAAQDFWVFVGRKLGRDLDYLVPIFSAGGGRFAVQRNLPSSNLSELYWQWVKDMTFMRAYDYFEDQTGECMLMFASVGPPVQGEDLPGTPWRWFPIPEPFPHVATLPPLSTHVIRAKMVDGYPRNFGIKESLRQADIRYKVYIDGIGACDDDSVPDGERRLDGSAALHYDLYIVVSNVSLTEDRNYRLDGYTIPTE
jgi:hypothetical protein